MMTDFKNGFDRRIRISSKDLKLDMKRVSNWGPYKDKAKEIALFSLGSLCEGHSPALPNEIDDLVAQRWAADARDITGARYWGHIPIGSNTDGHGADDWIIFNTRQEKAYRMLVNYLKQHVKILEKTFVKPRKIFLISGHGGWHFLVDREKQMEREVGVPVEYAWSWSREWKKVIHSGIGEHSIADYLGYLNRRGHKMINRIARKDPEEALKRWPTLMGLMGYILSGNSKYITLRKEKKLPWIKWFLDDKKGIPVYKELGKRLYNKHLNYIVKRIRLSMK